MNYKHFYLLQRISAIYVLIFGIYLFASLYQVEYSSFLHFFHSPFNRVGFLLFYLMLIGHTYIGINLVIDDYIKNSYKIWVSYLVNFSLLVALLLVLDFLWS